MLAVNEQFAQLGDVELCYETFGDPTDAAMLLVMGLGTQMLGWHADFCRQLAAIIASGDRTPLLRTITAPTVVIHGTKDKLVPPSGARATAKAIAGARLVLIEGMGHDLPRFTWPRMLDEIERNAARAGEPAAAA